MKTVWLIPAFAVLLLGAGCALSRTQTNEDALHMASSPAVPLEQESPALTTSSAKVAVETMAAPAQEEGASAAPVRNFDLNAGDFYFDPKSLSVKTGETFTITFGSVTGSHVFTIDELGISKPMSPGEVLTLTAPATPGRYTYYCSVGPHKTLGMTGILVVE